jgi:Holliday junction resolvase RusA-like endonuclease
MEDRKPPPQASVADAFQHEVIEIDDSSFTTAPVAAAAAASVRSKEVIEIHSSSSLSSSSHPFRKRAKPGRNMFGKKKKAKKSPPFQFDTRDPFAATGTSTTFCVRGKPLPQSRDRQGWNLTRYNPSKRLQNEFCQVASDLCQSHIGSVPSLGKEALVKVKVEFRFPSPKTGLLKNTADIDNMCKFVLDALNTTFYGDDGQVSILLSDKAYDDGYGGNGYTMVTISNTQA